MMATLPDQPTRATAKPAVAAFFGCVDLKYSEDGTVSVLELGDGHTSGFTGAGAFIPRAFENFGYTRKLLSPAVNAIIENKVLTHDAFVNADLLHLRPRGGAFPLTYSPSLASEVLASVNGGPCVLKLCDRQRGCGVVVVQPEDLDETLQKLLAQGPSNGKDDLSLKGRQAKIRGWVARAERAAHLSGVEEQVSHWHADECPSFLAEALCKSKLVEGPGGRYYDGTLRVGFALEYGENGPVAQCLGAYWKLPDAAADDMAATVCTRTVSHSHGGSGNVTCIQDDEIAVWAALHGTLPKLFHLQYTSVPGLIEQYGSNPLLLIAALCRVAGGYIENTWDVAQNTLFLAEQILPLDTSPIISRVRSYLLRTRGTVYARQSKGSPKWDSAGPYYEEALEVMPLNAAAAYLTGMTLFARQSYESAAAHFAQSLSADCDFAPAYSQLATCCLLLGDPKACVEISEAMLLRHHRVAAGHHHIAAALYAEEATSAACDSARRHKAIAALQRAKELQRGKSWAKEDDAMLEALSGSLPVPKVPLRTWLFHAWRL